MEKNVIGKECRHVVHFQLKRNETIDIHSIKEIIHTEDGERIPNLRIVKNYERPIWITKPIYRKHKQKKEYEILDRLQMYKIRESDIRKRLSKLLGRSENMVQESPYVYGLDTHSCALIKYRYKKQYPNVSSTPYKVAVFDFETDVDERRPKILTVATKDEIHTAIIKSAVKSIDNPVARIKECFLKHIPDDEYRKIPLHIHVVDDEVQLIRKIFNIIHTKLKPDWLAAWNVTFDLGVILDTCDRYKISIKNILCDPDIPSEYRMFNFRKAPVYKQKENGDRVPVEIQEQWHTIETTSHFQIIDAMCTYAIIRLGTPKVSGGYSLDNILEHEGIAKKLSFPELHGDEKEKEDWHRDMLENHPIEYTVYNIWDCLSILRLDEKTKDMQLTLPMMLDCSLVRDFKSQPKRLRDQMFFYLYEQGKIMGTAPRSQDDLNKHLLGTKDWIVTLPSDLIVDNGLRPYVDYPNISTNIRAHVYDNDAVSSYPSNIRVANVSKSTTRCELSSIDGIPRHTFLKQNVNLTVGKVNAIEYCTTMFNFPSLIELLDNYETPSDSDR